MPHNDASKNIDEASKRIDEASKRIDEKNKAEELGPEDLNAVVGGTTVIIDGKVFGKTVKG